MLAINMICLVWAGSFVFYYLSYVRYFTHTLVWAEGGSVPSWPFSFKHLQWVADIILNFYINSPLCLEFWVLGMALSVLGLVYMFSAQKRRFLFLIAPVMFTFLAALCDKYPFIGRLVLFLVPLAYIFIAAGVAFVKEKFGGGWAYTIAIMICLLAAPILYEITSIVNPGDRFGGQREEGRSVIAKVKELKQAGDALYVYYGAVPVFQYYAQRFGFQSQGYILGTAARNDPEEYARELERLRGRGRVWFLFSHVYGNEEKYFLQQLDRMGKKLFEFERPAASSYLYDLSRK